MAWCRLDNNKTHHAYNLPELGVVADILFFSCDILSDFLEDNQMKTFRWIFLVVFFVSLIGVILGHYHQLAIVVLASLGFFFSFWNDDDHWGLT